MADPESSSLFVCLVPMCQPPVGYTTTAVQPVVPWELTRAKQSKVEIATQIYTVAEFRDTSLTGMVTAPGDTEHYYVLEQAGRVWKVHKDHTREHELFLDLSKGIQDLYEEKPLKSKTLADERGLLNIAFHPDFSTEASLYQGVFLVFYSSLDPIAGAKMFQDESDEQPDHYSCLVQYQYLSGNTPQDTAESMRPLLCVSEPQMNHNGGGLVFHPHDGLLWVGLGDGGGAGDKHGRKYKDAHIGFAQNPMSVHGKLLRLEVVQPIADPEEQYRVPTDNPFVSTGGAHDEIVGWGLRNPWRMSFDRDGTLLIADVGQNRFESIKSQSTLGVNHGWRAYEGFSTYSPEIAEWITRKQEQPQFPLIAYPRSYGVAVVGVFRYRGRAIPELQGKLVFADYTGHVMVANDGDSTPRTLLKLDKQMIHALAEDASGELYLMARNTKTGHSSVYQIQSNTVISTAGVFPGKILDTGPVLTNLDIKTILSQALTAAHNTSSSVRLGGRTHTKMHIAIIDRGWTHAVSMVSMDDAWIGSKEIARNKANTALWFSSNENALTSRTIGALSQPGKPLWQIGNMGGITEFPGGVPLYKYGKLVGAIGVSGDGVDEDEAVAKAAVQGYEAPVHIRNEPFYAQPPARSPEDTLEVETIYVRVVESAHPDSKAPNVYEFYNTATYERFTGGVFGDDDIMPLKENTWIEFVFTDPESTAVHPLYLTTDPVGGAGLRGALVVEQNGGHTSGTWKFFLPDSFEVPMYLQCAAHEYMGIRVAAVFKPDTMILPIVTNTNELKKTGGPIKVLMSSNRSVSSLAPFRAYSHMIVVLSLFHTRLVSLEWLDEFTALRVLDLSLTGITDNQVPVLQYVRGLEHLSLSGNDITVLPQLYGSRNTLRVLEFSRVQVRRVMTLSSIKNLAILDLSGNPQLTEMPILTSLIDLDIRDTGIDRDTVLYDMPNIFTVEK